MIPFDLEKLMFDKRFNQKELAAVLNIRENSLMYMKKRRTVKPSFVRKLETIFNNVDKYIINENQTTN